MPKKAPKITPKLKSELTSMVDAIRLLSCGWVKQEDGYRRSGVEGEGESWDVFTDDIRALMCVNLLKSFSDAAIKTQYGQKALAILRDIQGRPQIETQKLYDFFHEIEAAEARKQGYEQTRDLGLVFDDAEPPEPRETLPSVITESITKLATSEAGYIPINGDARQFSVDNAQTVTVTAALTVPEEMRLTKDGKPWKLSATGLMIQDAIGSMMYKPGKPKLDWTLNELNELLGGTRRLTPKRRAELENEIEIQRNTDYYIDWTNQLNDMRKTARKRKDKKTLKHLEKCKAIFMDDKLLSVKKGVIKLKNGEEVVIYHTNAEPGIFEYSRHTGQRMNIPVAALNVPGLKAGGENDALTRHLHLMIAIARNFRKPQNIKLDTLLERLEKVDCFREERARIIERVTKCLEHYAEIKFIRKFTPIHGARGKLTGWTITPMETKAK